MGEVGESSTPGVGLKRVVVVPLVEFGSALPAFVGLRASLPREVNSKAKSDLPPDRPKIICPAGAIRGVILLWEIYEGLRVPHLATL